jgi:hypothetical protein
MSEIADTDESDESNIQQRTHTQNVSANVTLDASCLSLLMEQPDAELRVHDDLDLLELIAEEDDTTVTAGITFAPTQARRIATRLMAMSTGGFLEELDTDRSNGCTRIGVSDDCVAYSYDDEPDTIVAGENAADGAIDSTRELTIAEAEQLRDDLEAALEALREEDVRRHAEQ